MFTRIITALSRTLLDEELSVAQVAALYLVDERRQMRIGELATELGRSLPSVSRLVDDLARRNLVERAEDPTDRRARVVTLSVQGSKFIERTGADRVATIREATQSTQLRDVVAKLVGVPAKKR